MRVILRPCRRSPSGLPLGAVVMAQQRAARPSPPGTARRTAADGSRWLTFGGNYANHRSQPADADHAGERQAAGAAVDVPDRHARQFRDDDARARQRAVRHRTAERRLGARRADRAPDLALPPRAAAEPDGLLRPRQPRLRRAWRQAVHDDARRASAGARHEDRRRRLGRDDGGLQDRLRVDARAARREGQGHRRRRRRRVRHPRVHRRLRRADRASGRGASTRFPALASRATTPGQASRGSAAAPASG